MKKDSNQFPITVITVTLAVMAFTCVVSVCYLAFNSLQIPPELNTLTGGLVGALTAMLVKTSPTETIRQTTPMPVPSDGSPTPVVVTNESSDPVPTTEEPRS
jgi:hypothetical protein